MTTRRSALQVLSANLLPWTQAVAKPGQEARDLRVISHHFTTAVRGVRTVISVRDPTVSRYLILKLAAKPMRPKAKLYTADFSLFYMREDGSEDRARCGAVLKAKGSKPGEFEGPTVGDGGFNVDGLDDLNFGLAFNVEPDVAEVELFVAGSAVSSPYRIGPDRKYSVWLTTNQDSTRLAEPRRLIEAADLLVNVSGELTKDARGVTVHYMERAETPAREMSQRLISALAWQPTLKKMELVSEHDVVVWVGQ